MVRLRRVGFHHWPDAPSEVDYLREVHRHEFHFQVEAKAGHANRAVEFHLLKRATEAALTALYGARHYAVLPQGMTEAAGEMPLQDRSCEQIAAELLEMLIVKWPVTAVEVWEDGENGARVEPSS